MNAGFTLKGCHVYSSWARQPPARFGGAEPNLTSTYLVSFRPSEPRTVVVRFRSINITLLRSEERARLISRRIA